MNEKAKFFTTNGMDIWSATIDVLRLQRIYPADGQIEHVNPDDLGCFVPIQMPDVGGRFAIRGEVDKSIDGTIDKTPSKTSTKQGTQTSKSSIETAAKTSSKLPRGRPAKFSKYKGVSKTRTRRDGSFFYRACVYKDKKNHHLGIFEIEELAAAAVQEFLGNNDEAQRLRDLAEQKNNNPDRPLPGTFWECNKCAHQHHVNQRPIKCEDCGNESLRKIIKPKDFLIGEFQSEE